MASAAPQIPSIPELIQCLKLNNADTQRNAAAFLQHVTYQNENNKELLRSHSGIPIIISLLKSENADCQFYAANVLRNLSISPNPEIKTQIETSRAIEILEGLIDNVHQYDRRFTEAIAAIICNLSCTSVFQSIISHSLLRKVVHYILLPIIGITLDPFTNKVHPFTISDLSIPYSPLLEYLTAFLKNMSSSTSIIRHQMRLCDGLVDSLTTIIQHGFDFENFNSKIVENCICTIRNLCFALHEMSQRKVMSVSENPKLNTKEEQNPRSQIPNNNVNFSNPRQSDIGHLLLLWNSEMIDLLLEFINDCRNYSSVEAAIGTVQNLAACKWNMTEEFRANFRRKKGLPLLILHAINGPDKVAKTSLIALKNLAEDGRNLELIGDHGLVHLLTCIPSPGCSILKRIIISDPSDNQTNIPEESLGLDTIYSALYLIYYILQKREHLCELFVKKNGVKNCMFLLKSDTFYRENFQNVNSRHSRHAEQLPILAAAILRLVWDKTALKTYFKQEKWNCEDFCVQSFGHRLKSSLSCSNDAEPQVYYGKPYVKARTNKLLPFDNRLDIMESRSGM